MTGPITTTSVNVFGINGYALAAAETAGPVFSSYTTAVNTIQQLLLPTPPATTPPTLSAADANTLNQQLNILRNLLTNGASVPVDSSNPSGSTQTYYVTTEMAQQLGVLFGSLDGVGVPVSSSAPIQMSLSQANAWQTSVNAAPILQGLVQYVGSASNRSIQSMIELDYIQTGNDMIAAQMGNLENALSTTQKTLNILATLQQIHNQIQVNSRSSFTSVAARSGFTWNPPSGSITASAYTLAYQHAASAFFGQRIVPVVGVGNDPYVVSPAAQYFVNEISFLTSQIRSQTPGISTADLNTLLTNFYAPQGQAGVLNPQYTFNLNAAFGALPPPPPDFLSQFGVFQNAALGPTSYSTFNANIVPAWNTALAVVQANNYTFSQDANGNTILTIPSGAVKTNFVKAYSLFQGSVVNAKSQLVILLAQLSALIPQLSATVPRLGATPANPGTEDPAGLTAKIRTVYNDLKNVFKTSAGARITSASSMLSSFSGLSKWLLDGYSTPQNAPSASQGGIFQQDITYAITAGQSLNDSQNEQVRQFLYVFEEYYKSASAILQALTQILQHMAQNIK